MAGLHGCMQKAAMTIPPGSFHLSFTVDGKSNLLPIMSIQPGYPLHFLPRAAPESPQFSLMNNNFCSDYNIIAKS
jgi:hypothetical protein